MELKNKDVYYEIYEGLRKSLTRSTRFTAASLLLVKGLEVPVAVAAMDDERVIVSLLDEASVDELRHQAGGSFAALHLILQLIDPALELVDRGELEGLLGILLFLLLLLSFDLRFGPAPLRAHFEHLGADTFAHCK